MRQKIERALYIKGMNIYGLSKIMGLGVSMGGSEAREGMHILKDHFPVTTFAFIVKEYFDKTLLIRF
jgi:phenylacetate-coenzyme A ligase PaaK-like adenylate-forming protein